MTPLHTRCPELARTETRGFVIAAGGPVPAGTYGIIEWFCEDPGCDCRRAFLQIISEREPAKILASLNYGWETRAFYRRLLPFDPQAPKEITDGSLDPINPQSPLAPRSSWSFKTSWPPPTTKPACSAITRPSKPPSSRNRGSSAGTPSRKPVLRNSVCAPD